MAVGPATQSLQPRRGVSGSVGRPKWPTPATRRGSSSPVPSHSLDVDSPFHTNARVSIILAGCRVSTSIYQSGKTWGIA